MARCVFMLQIIQFSKILHLPSEVSPPWNNPCSGSRQTSRFDDLILETDNKERYEHYDAIIEKIEQAQHKLVNLKDKFVRERFDGNQDHVNQLNLFKLNGMPSTRNRNPMMSANQEMSVAEFAYEDLAKLSVFLEQALVDETRFEPRERSYAKFYRDIEETIFWLLCQLQKYSYEMSEEQVQVDVSRDIMNMQMRTVGSSALRYNRDFIILRDGITVLDQLMRIFSQMKEQSQ